MRLISLSSLFLILFVFTACKKGIKGEGPAVTENRNMANFSGVSLNCSAELTFKQEPNYKVEVSAQQNILDILITEVSDNRLTIRFKNDVKVRSHERISVIVTSPVANSFRISGSGSIQSPTAVISDFLDLDISGSGNITLAQATTTRLLANISGSGNIMVAGGNATDERLTISGSGNINLSSVVAKNVNTTTSGSGEMRVYATEQLNVGISGSGSVFYFGNPHVSASISGTGNIRKL